MENDETTNVFKQYLNAKSFYNCFYVFLFFFDIATVFLLKPFVYTELTIIDSQLKSPYTEKNNITFAIDGKTWINLRAHYAYLIPRLLMRTTVFARFQPDQKTQLVLQFQKLDYVVSMVGDGTNDCGALKAAHVGVSLSRAEASVAAPFTSSIENISCLLYLILEGRCALVTTFAMIKYMAMYSLIQFTSVMILYINHSLMGDAQFLFVDLIIITSLALTIGRQGPSTTLGSKRPLGSLFSARNLVPFSLQVTTCVGIQTAAIIYLHYQFWYEPLPAGTEQVVETWENTVVFCISSFQYIILALIYSKGRPYRDSLLTNVWLLLIAVTLTCFVTWLTICPQKDIADMMDIIYNIYRTREQLYFRASLILFPIVNFILSSLIEICLADSTWFHKFLHVATCKTHSKSKYKQLMQCSDVPELFTS